MWRLHQQAPGNPSFRIFIPNERQLMLNKRMVANCQIAHLALPSCEALQLLEIRYFFYIVNTILSIIAPDS